MEEKKKSNKKVVLGVIVLAALIAVFVGAFFLFRPKTSEGSKTITIEVAGRDKHAVTYTVKTDAEYLRQAMEEADGLTFSGSESEYGMMVDTINGETADYNTDGSYWAFYINGEYCNYGIDSQPVTDGDSFKIEYTVYAE